MLLPVIDAATLSTGRIAFPVKVGAMEVLVSMPKARPCGVLMVAHPQPLMGGSANHKIPHWLARDACAEGWVVMRPNFRGVGASEGTHDEGRGEAADLLSLALGLGPNLGALPLVLAGFSFGAFVQCSVAGDLRQRGSPATGTVLLGLPCGDVPGGRHYATPEIDGDCLLIHGENDKHAPLDSLLDWARPQGHPVVVIPGADHFFNPNFDEVRKLVSRSLRTWQQ